MRLFSPPARLVLGVSCCLMAGTAWAVIERLTPLGSVISDADYIFLAKIEKVDPARPSVVLNVAEDLKGKPEYRRLAVNLTGDKEKHTPELLKRIAADLPLVVFVTVVDERQLTLAYTNGTWFQLIGTPDGGQVRWAFTHCEPFLRRTFKGTTAELETLVRGVVAGKAKAPPPNKEEKPGFGPEVEGKKE
jgi:hypothetical protein